MHALFLLCLLASDSVPQVKFLGETGGSAEVYPSPVPPPSQKPLPINLPSALALAGSAPLDIAIAAQRVEAAAADLDRANALWLPTIFLGADYFRHDGQLQDIAGRVFTTSRSAMMAGAGPSAVFALSDAIYTPLAARKELAARRADSQAARNDITLLVAQTYFDVQRARGEVAGSLETVRRASVLLSRAEKIAPGLVPELEVARVRNELSRRKLAVESAYESWQIRSADLTRVLRLEPSTLVVPVEPPQMSVTLTEPTTSLDNLVVLALTKRPELRSHQASVQAAITRLQQERLRPLVPSVLLRGNATNPSGTLSSGYFGGGVNSNVGAFAMRNSVNVQVVWELQNLGLGNRALVRRRTAEQEEAHLRLFRLQDQIAAEVVQAHARLERARVRRSLAEDSLRDAQTTLDKSLDGLTQTKRTGEMLILVVRPQEVVAALSALDQGYRDYYTAVTDANRAEFELYRALGHPAQEMLPNAKPPADKPQPLAITTSLPLTR
ncbi:MAG: TolC family protein [Planctomycetia bacterium]|nr:TolC family protein [Planctomycetia bacterium]